MGRLRSLDTLKGVCAIIITVYHGFALFGKRLLLPHGYLAVEIFFMISGYLMMSRLDEVKLIARGFKDFFIKRIVRIYPLYLLVFILGAWFTAYRMWAFDTYDRQIETYIASFFTNIFVLPNMHAEAIIKNGTTYPFAFQVWTIFWEFVIAIIFYFWVKFGQKSPIKIFIIIFSLFAMALLFNPWINQYRPSLNVGWNNRTFEFGGGRAILSLFAGILVAKYIVKLDKKYDFFLVCAAWIILVVGFYYFNVRKTYLIFEYILTYIGFPIMIAGFVKIKSPIVNNRIGDFLGSISYSVFMMHGFTLTAARTYAVIYQYKPDMIYGTCWLVTTICLAYFAHQFVEKPAGDYLTKKMVKK